MQDFRTPMLPWPTLAPYAQKRQVAGREVFFYDSVQETERSPCLLIHGLGDESDTWRRIFPELASGRRVVALDLPGFGRSMLPEKSPGIETYAKTILELLDTLQIEKTTLVGHSMGAIISQFLALSNPQRFSRLVLIAGGLGPGKTPLNLTLLLFLIPGIGELVYNGLRGDAQRAYRTLEPYYHALDHLAQTEKDFLYTRVNQRVWSDQQRTAFLASLRSLAAWLPAQQKNLAAQLATCQIPTTFLWGKQDRIAPVENAHLLASLLPGETTRLFTLDNCGHNLQQEQPIEILKILGED